MNNDELKELFEAHTTALKAEVKSQNELLGYKMDEMIKHQKITNGRVNKLEERADCFDQHLTDTNRVWKWRKLIVIALIALVMTSSIVGQWAYERVNIVKSIEQVLSNKGIVYEEENN